MKTKTYEITFGYYESMDDWKLHFLYRDEDDHYKCKRTTVIVNDGTDAEGVARAYFDDLIERGGEVVEYHDEFGKGILLNKKVYTNITVWEDERNGNCFDAYHFF